MPQHKREEREALFSDGKLPVLFCSPTMELGIDISRPERRAYAQCAAHTGELCAAQRRAGRRRGGRW